MIEYEIERPILSSTIKKEINIININFERKLIIFHDKSYQISQETIDIIENIIENILNNDNKVIKDSIKKINNL